MHSRTKTGNLSFLLLGSTYIYNVVALAMCK